MIEITDLDKSYGSTPVLQGASCTVEAGTAVALVGPNGSGKTTTLHVLAGLAAADSGRAAVNGVDVTADRYEVQKQIAFLPQDVRFHSALSPRQVLRFYAGLRPEQGEDGETAPRSEQRENRIGPLLEQVDLTDAADQPCGSLSGGMRQRLGLALLELAGAPVWLLDEPALSLDPEWRTYLTDRLRAHTDAGGTVLMATHLLDVWTPLVDRVLRCAEGAIQPMEADNVPADRAPTPAS